MARANLYCRSCDERFNDPPGPPSCPRCGQTLVSWMDQPTLEFGEGGDDDVRQRRALDDELIGTQLGTYQIEDFLGEGGMARVYRAKHLMLERPCAIKILRPRVAASDPESVSSFLAEARSAAALVHPHVVALHTIGHEAERHFIEMEFVDGESLARLLQLSGPLDVTEATRLLVQISSALAVAHDMGMIHRDIKPANVMIREDGVAKLADFGLAKRLVARAGGKVATVMSGTPHYMAPELFQGEPADRRTDVYAMGVTYFCLLTGQLPIKTDSLTELARIHAAKTNLDLDEVVRVAGKAARTVLQRCLAFHPEDRYANAQQLHAEFRALYGSLRNLESLLNEALLGTDVTIHGAGDRFVVIVELDQGRSQRVHVRGARGAAVADQVVEIYSVCGPMCERYFRRALELNAEIPHGSIALQDVDGQPHFVMSNAYPRATCDPEEVRQSVFTIAKHADEVEHRLTGEDRH